MPVNCGRGPGLPFHAGDCAGDAATPGELITILDEKKSPTARGLRRDLIEQVDGVCGDRSLKDQLHFHWS